MRDGGLGVSAGRREIRLDWIDRDTYETARLAAEAYGLSLTELSPKSARRADAAFAGRRDAVEAFESDMLEFGAVEPFLTGSPAGRAEYLAWLAAELGKIGVDFRPSAVKSS